VRTPERPLAPVIDIEVARKRHRLTQALTWRAEVRTTCRELDIDCQRLVHGCCRSWQIDVVELAELTHDDLARLVMVLRERRRSHYEALMRPGYGR
jgi:hypothetical protein